jgi:hypothetical protein
MQLILGCGHHLHLPPANLAPGRRLAVCGAGRDDRGEDAQVVIVHYKRLAFGRLVAVQGFRFHILAIKTLATV